MINYLEEIGLFIKIEGGFRCREVYEGKDKNWGLLK